MLDPTKLPLWISGDGNTVRATKILNVVQGGDSPLESARFLYLDGIQGRVREDGFAKVEEGSVPSPGMYLVMEPYSGAVIYVPAEIFERDYREPKTVIEQPIQMVDAAEPILEQDDATDIMAAHAMLEQMQAEAKEKDLQILDLKQRNEALMDVARIQISGQVIAALVTKQFPRNDDDWQKHCNGAVMTASYLVDYWEDLIEKKARAYLKAVEEVSCGPQPDPGAEAEGDEEKTVN